MKIKDDKESWDRLIETLQLARSAGFNLEPFSAIETLGEALSDICFLIIDNLKEGSLPRGKNPDVKFLENSKADELGNTRSIKVFPARVMLENSPELLNAFRVIASIGMTLQTGKVSFMDIKRRLGIILNPIKEAKEVPIDSKKGTNKEIKKLAYYRRKKTRQNTHQL
jgi:hypothetical protein